MQRLQQAKVFASSCARDTFCSLVLSFLSFRYFTLYVASLRVIDSVSFALPTWTTI
uniref:Uncharacterized protein n=1 Tax=Anguilla anguilla TaxID=7936 RepID=A0A0E9X2L5_ANGAN